MDTSYGKEFKPLDVFRYLSKICKILPYGVVAPKAESFALFFGITGVSSGCCLAKAGSGTVNVCIPVLVDFYKIVFQHFLLLLKGLFLRHLPGYGLYPCVTGTDMKAALFEMRFLRAHSAVFERYDF